MKIKEIMNKVPLYISIFAAIFLTLLIIKMLFVSSCNKIAENESCEIKYIVVPSYSETCDCFAECKKFGAFSKMIMFDEKNKIDCVCRDRHNRDQNAP